MPKKKGKKFPVRNITYSIDLIQWIQILDKRYKFTKHSIFKRVLVFGHRQMALVPFSLWQPCHIFFCLSRFWTVWHFIDRNLHHLIVQFSRSSISIHFQFYCHSPFYPSKLAVLPVYDDNEEEKKCIISYVKHSILNALYVSMQAQKCRVWLIDLSASWCIVRKRKKYIQQTVFLSSVAVAVARLL